MTTLFQGNATVTWGKPDKGSNSNSFSGGVGTSGFKWGVVSDPPSYGAPNNKIGFAPAPLGFKAQEDSKFLVGLLSTWNSAIEPGTGIESVPMVVTLNLDGPKDTTQKFEFDLDISSVRSGAEGGIYSLGEVASNNTFEDADGNKYSLKLAGFSNDEGKTLSNRFSTSYEYKNTDYSTLLYGQIVEVEEPPKRPDLPDDPDIVVPPPPRPQPPRPRPNPPDIAIPITTTFNAGDLNEGSYRKTQQIGFTEGDSRNLVDEHEFTITAESEVNVILDQLRQNADIELLEADTNVILFQSTESGTRREKITEVLEPGDYSVKVYTEGSEQTNYRLALDADRLVEEKDSIGTAKNLGVLGVQDITEIDKIGFGTGVRRDQRDYYKFTLDAKSDVFLTLDQLKSNADVEIIDGDGRTMLFESTNSGTQQEVINKRLEGGDYYVLVTPEGSSKTDYQLTISGEEFIPEVDDTKPGVNLGILTPMNEINRAGDIGLGRGISRDTKDFYTFSLPSENIVTLTLDNLKENANVEVLNEDSEIIWRGEKTGRQNEVLVEQLPAGDYMVRVYPEGEASTDYRLKMTAQWPYIDDYAEGTAEAAFEFGAIGGDTQRITNDTGIRYRSQSGRDTQDWFRFELEQDANVNINLRQLKNNLDLVLYEDDGSSILFDSKRGGRKNERINEDLEEGEYYVKVAPKGGASSKYQLTLNADVAPPEPELFNAGDITNLEGGYSNNNRIGFAGPGVRNATDRYFFSLTEERQVDINLDQMRRDANIELFKANGQKLFDSFNSGKTPDEISEILDAGDYVLEVIPQGNAKTSYQLGIEASITDNDVDKGPPGTGPVNEIGELTEEFVREDEIGFSMGEGTRDQNDYYEFTLTEETLVDIGLDVDADANLQLLDSAGVAIDRSTNRGKQSESIEQTLDAGTYYVRVYPQGGAKAEYTLTITPGDDIIVEDPDGTPPGTDIGVLDSYNVSDAIGFTEGGRRDQNDYRKFTLSEKSRFSLNLTGLRQNADVRLYDIDDTLLETSRKGGTSDEKINTTLEAGDYYVQVMPKGAARTQYDLNMSATPIGGPDDEPKELGPLDSSTDPLTAGGVINNTVRGVVNTEDLYEFILPEGNFVDVSLDGLSGNADLELYDGSQLLGSSFNSGSSAEEIDGVFLDSGTYTAKVVGTGEVTPYNLSIGLG